MTWRGAVAGTCVVGLLAGGVHLLREATESTHYRTDPRSRLRVVVEANSKRAEYNQTLAELTEGHIWFCRLEIASDPVGELQSVPGYPHRFAIVLAPSLDSTNRKQYRGCLEDWTLDHHRLRVISMDEVGEDPAP